MSQSEGDTVSISTDGAMAAVEQLRGRDLPDVFSESEPDELAAIADRLEERLNDLASEPMNNRNDIERLAFKVIVLRNMAGDTAFLGNGRRQDDEDEMESDGEGGESDDDGNGEGLGDLEPDDEEEVEEDPDGNNNGGGNNQNNGEDSDDEDEDEDDDDNE